MQLPRWSPRRRTHHRTPALLREERKAAVTAPASAYNHPDSQHPRQLWGKHAGGFFPQEPVPRNKSAIYRDKYSGLQQVVQTSGHKAAGSSPAALEQQVLELDRKVSHKPTREKQNRSTQQKNEVKQLKLQSILRSVEAWQTLTSPPFVGLIFLPPCTHLS